MCARAHAGITGRAEKVCSAAAAKQARSAKPPIPLCSWDVHCNKPGSSRKRFGPNPEREATGEPAPLQVVYSRKKNASSPVRCLIKNAYSYSSLHQKSQACYCFRLMKMADNTMDKLMWLRKKIYYNTSKKHKNSTLLALTVAHWFHPPYGI